MKQKHNVNIEEYLNMVLWQNKSFCCVQFMIFPFRTYIAPVESNQALGPYHRNIG